MSGYTRSRLRLGLNLGTLVDLPASNRLTLLDGSEVYREIAEAGFVLVQGGDDALAARAGLDSVGMGRVDTIGDALRIALDGLDRGYSSATLHVGTGFEDDIQAGELVADVLSASEETGFPLFIETHRATITQDPWRTLKLIERFPSILFNGDFSHWYTGVELTYGDFEAKLDLLQPVFDRVRFLHGRIGSPGCIQVDIGDEADHPSVTHFRDMWTRSFRGFLATAAPDETIAFVPELLSPAISYARTFRTAEGRLVEEGDRWSQAQLLTRLASESFDEAWSRDAAASTMPSRSVF